MLAQALNELKAIILDSRSLKGIPDGHKIYWMFGEETITVTEDRDAKRRIYFESLPAFAAAVAAEGTEGESIVIPTTASDYGFECELEDSILTFRVQNSETAKYWSASQCLDHKQFVLNCRKFGGISAADLQALQTLNSRATSSAEFKQGRDKGVAEFVVEQQSEMIPDFLILDVQPFRELQVTVQLRVELIVHPNPVRIETHCRDICYTRSIVQALEISAQLLRSYLEDLKCSTPVYC